MIPLSAVLTIRKKQAHSWGQYWIPLAVIWVLLLPLIVLLAPVILIVCLIEQLNPFHLLTGIWSLFRSLRGTHIELENDRRSVLIDIA